MIYFIIGSIIVSVILYLLNTHDSHIDYVDCWFLAVSAMTITGLSTVPISKLTLWQQVLLFILTVLGNMITVSVMMVGLRRWWMSHQLSRRRRLAYYLAEQHHEHSDSVSDANTVRSSESRSSIPLDAAVEKALAGGPKKNDNPDDQPLYNLDEKEFLEYVRHAHESPDLHHLRRRKSQYTVFTVPRMAVHRAMSQNLERGLGAFPSPFTIAYQLYQEWALWHHVNNPKTKPHSHSEMADIEAEARRIAPYLTFGAYQQKVSGSKKDAVMYELTDLELRALTLLLWLIPVMWTTLVLLAILTAAPYLNSRAGARYWDAIKSQDKPPISATWFWVFNCVSAMANSGLSLSDISMGQPLGASYLMVLPMIVLMLLGNVLFPVWLRGTLLIIKKFTPKTSQLHITAHFLLNHPRRCYLYLFRAEITWLLLIVVLLLTMVDWLLLLLLDLPGRKSFPSVGTWILDALFQSVSIRNTGFQIFNIQQLAPAEQLVLMFMMYFCAYPLAMAIRSTNVYEEQALGIFTSPQDDNHMVNDGPRDDSESQEHDAWGHFLGEHIRQQLSYDLWYIALAIWIVCIAERGQIKEIDPSQYAYMNVFTIMFEMVSAYGNVGLSIGSQHSTASMSHDFSKFSKIITTLVMLRGRHRDLPAAIDRAIIFPQNVQKHE